MNLSGIHAPIPTPFDDRERVALDKLAANLTRWCEQGLDGVVMPGSNSEAPFLSRAERIELWRTCGEVLSGTGTGFISGTGAETTAESIELTQKAAEAGAQATLLIPPHFYRSGMTHDRLVAHYRTVADESPVPLLIYNVPAFTGIDFALETLTTLAEHPGIVGIKDSSSNVVKMAGLLAMRPDFLVFAGTGSALLPFLSIGAVGGIMALANFAAPRLRELLEAFKNGDQGEARRLQISLARINTAVTARYGVPGLKWAMDRMGFHGGICRRPLTSLSSDQARDIEGLLAEAGLRSS